MPQGHASEDRLAKGPSSERVKLTRLEAILFAQGLVTAGALKEARQRQAGAKVPLIEVLLEQKAIDEEAVVAAIARESGMVPLADADLTADPAVQGLVPTDVAQRLGILPLRVEGGTLIVATADPFQLPAFDDIAARAQLPVRARLARPSAVRDHLRLARPEEELLGDVLRHVGGGATEIVFAPDAEVGGEDDTKVSDIATDVTLTDSPVVRFLNLVLTDAIRQGASDIHIECEKDALRVRIRVDGDLHEIQRVSARVRTSVLSRLKIVAGLDIMETRRPQDGRAHVVVEGRNYDLRVSTLPSYFGEKAVIRILDPAAPVFDLSKSGIEPEELGAWRELLRRPNGLILMTGPTGSGKTSTLYASLLEVRDPTLNLVTVEDPVEYQFPGIVHVPMRADIGFTFATALRSILRQDPDVILVGEIRDAETAEVAVQAALTGHLVLSTLHTNDATGAVSRMFNLGVPPHLLSSCLLGVMAQRLVRLVCTGCGEPTPWQDATMEQLGFPTIPTSPPTLRRGKGCARCRATGFKGRAAIAELLRVTRPIRRLILDGASEQVIRAQGRRDGMRSLTESGIVKVLAGVTTPEEVLAVAGPLDPEDVAVKPGVDARAPTPVSAPHRPEAAPALRGGGTCAIVCDDEPVQRRIIAAAVRADFPDVVEVADGTACLDAVARLRPAVVLVDHHMPGLTGVDVIKRLRAALETVALPILMLTASDDESLEAQVLGAGADDYLRKPVSPAQLRTRIAAVLASRAGGASRAGTQPPVAGTPSPAR